MKKQNVLNLFAVGALALALAFGVQSCKKDDPDPCEDVTCSGNGSCSDGTCACDDGYIGSNCETEDRAKYEGSWKYNENCPSWPPVNDYSVTITESSSGVTKVAISGFAGFACGSDIVVICSVDGNEITVAGSQSYCGGQVVIKSGTGTLNSSGTTLSFDYAFTFAGTDGNCSGTYTKL